MNELGWPMRDCVVHIARFHPSNAIPNLIDSYACFRKLLEEKAPSVEPPQKLICGHSTVDDPDATIIYDQVMQLIHRTYAEYAKVFVVIRCPPSN